MTDSLPAPRSDEGRTNATVAPAEVTDDTEMLVGSAHFEVGAALADISSTRDVVTRDAARTTATASPGLFTKRTRSWQPNS